MHYSCRESCTCIAWLTVGVCSIELHTLHLNRVLVLSQVHDLGVGGSHLAIMSLYKLKASMTYRMAGNFRGKSERSLKINYCGFKFS